MLQGSERDLEVGIYVCFMQYMMFSSDFLVALSSISHRIAMH